MAADLTENEKPTPPWANEIPEGSFISYSPTYKVGEYFDRFKKDSDGKLDYYFYDPTEHGFEKSRKYPLLVIMHGTSNALEGDVCINYAGAEFYSKEEYQSILGGAYILVPLAPEYRGDDGKVHGHWPETDTKTVYELICNFIKKHAEQNGDISKKAILGNSSGGAISLKLSFDYPDFFNAVVPMGAPEIPDEKLFDLYDQNDVHLFFAMGKRDEVCSYEKDVVPLLPRMKSMKHCYVFTPDWVCNGDHGIASINFGFEMGQHCIINPMHCNLMFDDGTLMDPNLPQGITGWLSEALRD
ncbi:MAG: hypothetical protein IKI90_06840 [Treponema sp.]|nr:hypothetical protein [Treponema sp.]